MATPDEWGTAFARQAQADFETWRCLSGLPSTPDLPKLPECQRLLFLQMACEKLAKAHLCKAGSDPNDLQTSHAYTKKNLPLILRAELVRQNAQDGLIRDLISYAKTLAQEIELLSPSVHEEGQRPDNCEYPWEDAHNRVRIPASHRFFTAQLLTQRHGRTVLKLISMAIRRLAG